MKFVGLNISLSSENLQMVPSLSILYKKATTFTVSNKPVTPIGVKIEKKPVINILNATIK